MERGFCPRKGRSPAPAPETSAARVWGRGTRGKNGGGSPTGTARCGSAGPAGTRICAWSCTRERRRRAGGASEEGWGDRFLPLVGEGERRFPSPDRSMMPACRAAYLGMANGVRRATPGGGRIVTRWPRRVPAPGSGSAATRAVPKGCRTNSVYLLRALTNAEISQQTFAALPCHISAHPIV